LDSNGKLIGTQTEKHMETQFGHRISVLFILIRIIKKIIVEKIDKYKILNVAIQNAC